MLSVKAPGRGEDKPPRSRRNAKTVRSFPRKRCPVFDKNARYVRSIRMPAAKRQEELVELIVHERYYNSAVIHLMICHSSPKEVECCNEFQTPSVPRSAPQRGKEIMRAHSASTAPGPCELVSLARPGARARARREPT